MIFGKHTLGGRRSHHKLCAQPLRTPGKDICEVVVKLSPKPMWANIFDDNDQKKEQFFIRTGNASNPLTPKEAMEYAAHRWKQ